ncbi:hypothetical protein PybrP1_004055 [[Pythium] brassicae (nom. inval.)]|nr:hypothetical protein PybrP1_004055 [[Pythium] brassicae (nom. inval.)]
MTSIFDGYDEEYRALTSDISKKISEVASYEDQHEKKKASILHIGDLLTQASQLVQQMELEVRSLDAATRRELSKKVDQYKKSLVSLKADHSAIREKEEREGLFGDRDDLAKNSQDQRNRMKAATDKMKGTTDKIDAARRTVAETEEVAFWYVAMVAALAITDELGRNRDKIKATHDKVKGVNDLASRGGSIVSRMSARDKRQRTALLAAAGFIAFAILLLIYFGIFKNAVVTKATKLELDPATSKSAANGVLTCAVDERSNIQGFHSMDCDIKDDATVESPTCTVAQRVEIVSVKILEANSASLVVEADYQKDPHANPNTDVTNPLITVTGPTTSSADCSIAYEVVAQCVGKSTCRRSLMTAVAAMHMVPSETSAIAQASLFKLALTGLLFGLVHMLTSSDHLSALTTLAAGSSDVCLGLFVVALGLFGVHEGLKKSSRLAEQEEEQSDEDSDARHLSRDDDDNLEAGDMHSHSDEFSPGQANKTSMLSPSTRRHRVHGIKKGKKLVAARRGDADDASGRASRIEGIDANAPVRWKASTRTTMATEATTVDSEKTERLDVLVFDECPFESTFTSSTLFLFASLADMMLTGLNCHPGLDPSC